MEIEVGVPASPSRTKVYAAELAEKQGTQTYLGVEAGYPYGVPTVLFGVTIASTAHVFLRDQAIDLRGNGWDVNIACSADDGTDSFAHLEEIQDIVVHAIPMERNPHPLKDMRALIAWFRLVSRVRPDILIFSTPKAALLASLAGRLLQVPVRIYHVRGLRLEGLTGISAKVGFAAEKAAIANSTAVLADSSSLVTAMVRANLLHEDDATVLGLGSCCGVDTNWYRPPSVNERLAARKNLGLGEKDFVIGFVGRITSDKGIGALVQTVERLYSNSPGMKLVLVGSLEDPDLVMSSLKGHHRPQWLSTHEHTEDPRRFYWAFDVFCYPSLREGFPIAPLEAQACGLPVITTDATGCVESIRPGETGLRFTAGDQEGLAQALRNLACDQGARQAMGRAARKWVVENFDATIVRSLVIDYISKQYQASTRTEGS